MDPNNSDGKSDAATSRLADDRPMDDQQIKAWAREILGLPEQADVQADRGPLLKKVAGERFVMSTSSDAALRIVLQEADQSDASIAAASIRANRQIVMKGRVEMFARCFFELGPEERRQRWNELKADCDQFPLLQLRLAQLEPGLNAEPGSDRSDLMAPDAAGYWFQRLFLATGNDRRRLLEQYRREVAGDRRRRTREISELAMHHPKIASLESALFDQVLDHDRRHHGRATNRTRRMAAARAWSVGDGIEQESSPLSAEMGPIGVLVVISIVCAALVAGFEKRESNPRRSHDILAEPPLSPEQIAIKRATSFPGTQQQIEGLERLVEEFPDNARYRYELAKLCLKSVKLNLRIVNGVMTIGRPGAAEKESLIRKTCGLLQGVVAEVPDILMYRAKFYEACTCYREYAEAKTRDSKGANSVAADLMHADTSNVANLDDLLQELHAHFAILAESHLQMNRPADALATILTQKRLFADDPSGLFYIAQRIGQLYRRLSRNSNEAGPEHASLIENCSAEVVDTLGAALAAGFDDVAVAWNAEELMPLREDPRFVALFAEYREQVERQNE